MRENDRAPITPSTRVGELLESYPELESVLFEISPAFAKLRNPVLRKTVARVTTLRQAAKVSGVSLGEMINRLRAEAGLGEVVVTDENGPGESSTKPVWYSPEKVVRHLDVRPMLESGEKPVGKVLADLAQMKEGEIYQLTAAFLPAPLIDLARERGFASWTERGDAETFQVYLCRPASPASSGEPLIDLT